MKTLVIMSVTTMLCTVALFYSSFGNTLTSQVPTGIKHTMERYQQTATATVKRVAQPSGTQTKPPKAIRQSNISYTSKEKRLANTHRQLTTQYKNAKTRAQKQQVLHKARHAFITANTSLAPYWYGTPWSFNGISQTPQEGSIACGYFVTTLLEDAGLKVQRAKLAQQASENIIKSLTTEKHIKRFHNASLKKFVTAVENWGAGLYVVGLDFHVGFIWHDGKDVHFIHSTYVHPKAAFSELATHSPVLASSKYRVIGKISDDDRLIKKWLLEKSFATKM